MEVISILFNDNEHELYEYLMSQKNPAKWLKERVRNRLSIERMANHE